MVQELCSSRTLKTLFQLLHVCGMLWVFVSISGWRRGLQGRRNTHSFELNLICKHKTSR
jgi:hypothetical protein